MRSRGNMESQNCNCNCWESKLLFSTIFVSWLLSWSCSAAALSIRHNLEISCSSIASLATSVATLSTSITSLTSIGASSAISTISTEPVPAVSVASSSSTSSSVTSTSTTSIATSTTTSATSASLAGLGLVDLDLLPIQGSAIHFPDGGLSSVLVLEGDEGVAFASVVDISDWSELLKLALELHVLEVLVDTIDEEFTSVACHS